MSDGCPWAMHRRLHSVAIVAKSKWMDLTAKASNIAYQVSTDEVIVLQTIIMHRESEAARWPSSNMTNRCLFAPCKQDWGVAIAQALAPSYDDLVVVCWYYPGGENFYFFSDQFFWVYLIKNE